MIDISKKSWHKYFLFGSLYFTEGIQASLAMVIIPIYLLDKGFSVPVSHTCCWNRWSTMVLKVCIRSDH